MSAIRQLFSSLLIPSSGLQVARLPFVRGRQCNLIGYGKFSKGGSADLVASRSPNVVAQLELGLHFCYRFTRAKRENKIQSSGQWIANGQVKKQELKPETKAETEFEKKKTLNASWKCQGAASWRTINFVYSLMVSRFWLLLFSSMITIDSGLISIVAIYCSSCYAYYYHYHYCFVFMLAVIVHRRISAIVDVCLGDKHYAHGDWRMEKIHVNLNDSREANWGCSGHDFALLS